MKELLLKLISLLHIAIVIFVIFTPFCYSEELLSIHFMLILLLYMHWISNNDDCSLTLAEKYLRGVDDSESFTSRLIKPIYTVNRRHNMLVIYFITLLALSLTCYKLNNIYQYRNLRQSFFIIYNGCRGRFI